MGIVNPVGYARYSTDKQTDNSIAYQKDAILRYCMEHNLALQRFYVDEGATGTNLERKGLQELIGAAKRKEFDAVIVYDISRGSRDIGDWFNFRSLMFEFGVTVISVKQKLGDIMNPNDFLQEAIGVTFAQFEVLQARSKSIAGSKQRASECKFMGGTPPLGYDVVDGHYVINEMEARWVRIIHLMYVMGSTYKEIIKTIPEARSKRGNPLNENSLHTILKNPRYDGTYIWNEKEHKVMSTWAGGTPKPEEEVTRIKNGMPAIVTPEIKREVMDRMADRSFGGRNAAKRDYLLSGLIECELCGSTYYGRTSKNKKGYETTSYACGNKYNYKRNGAEKCTAKNINANDIETFVVTHLKHYLKTADFTQVAQEISRQINSASADLKTEKSELAKINSQLHNGMKAVLDGMYFPELQAEMDRLRVRKNELEDIINRAESERPTVSAEAIVRLFKESVDQMDQGDMLQIIRHHVTKIYAHADGSCTVNMGVCVIGCGGAQHVVHTTYYFKVA